PAATPPTVIASNVVALEARYGLDLLPAAAPDGFVDTYTDVLPPNTPDNRIVAVRLAIVTRGTIPERVTVLNRANPNLIPLWDGGPTLDVDSTNDPEARNYRYRVFQTTIPLRNGIWNN
ncbi:MAG TPA: PilW family protein, partial [Rhodocyclaceae bacterium]|nr:PilW family protein [Rhodocyclaceae bacterium]